MKHGVLFTGCSTQIVETTMRHQPKHISTSVPSQRRHCSHRQARLLPWLLLLRRPYEALATAAGTTLAVNAVHLLCPASPSWNVDKQRGLVTEMHVDAGADVVRYVDVVEA